MIISMANFDFLYITMEYLKNITRFGLNFIFLANVMGSSLPHFSEDPARLRRYWCFLLFLHFHPFIALVCILMRVLIALAAQHVTYPKFHTNHTHASLQFYQQGLSGTKLRNVLKLSVSRMHLSDFSRYLSISKV